MRFLILITFLTSCSLHRTKGGEERTTYEFTRESILRMGYSSYMAGCVRTANKFGKKKYAPECMKSASEFVKSEIDEIVFK